MADSESETGRVEFERQRGPCMGDFWETKDRGKHRIAYVGEGFIKLADRDGTFSLGDDGRPHYGGGGYLPGPEIPISSLGRPYKREKGLFNRTQWVFCRVFKEE